MNSMSSQDEDELWRWWEERAAPTTEDDLFVEKRDLNVFAALAVATVVSVGIYAGVGYLLFA